MKLKCITLCCALSLANASYVNAMESERLVEITQQAPRLSFEEHISIVKYLIAHQPSSSDPRLYSYPQCERDLDTAIKNKNVEEVKAILGNKWRPKITIDNVLSTVALEGEQLDLLDLLVSHGAPVNSKICSDYGNYENLGANYGTIYFPNGTSPLLLATQLNKPNIVKYLLTKKANPLRCYKKVPNIDCGYFREELYRNDYHCNKNLRPVNLLSEAKTEDLKIIIDNAIQAKRNRCCTIQ